MIRPILAVVLVNAIIFGLVYFRYDPRGAEKVRNRRNPKVAKQFLRDNWQFFMLMLVAINLGVVWSFAD